MTRPFSISSVRDITDWDSIHESLVTFSIFSVNVFVLYAIVVANFAASCA